MTKNEFHKAVQTERQHQIEKWGDQSHASSKWLTILVEEIGEIASEIIKNIISDNKKSSIDSELIQASAVIEAWITQESPNDADNADDQMIAILMCHIGKLAKTILESENGITKEKILKISRIIETWGDTYQ